MPEYFFNQERMDEMTRLLKQDRLVTRAMGSLLPPGISPPHALLDIACGPGGWVLEVARRFPTAQVTGIDLSLRMLEYAQAQKEVEEVQNATFRQMDATKPLDFKDASFDLVNARLIFGFMDKTTWPSLLAECRRITRPGGTLRLTEGEAPITTGPATERLNAFFVQALSIEQKSFSPDGRHTSVTPMLKHWMKDAGFVNLRQHAYFVNYGAGEEAHNGWVEDMTITFQQAQPWLLQHKIASAKEIDQLYHQMLAEMHSSDFRAIWYFLSTWGQRE